MAKHDSVAKEQSLIYIWQKNGEDRTSNAVLKTFHVEFEILYVSNIRVIFSLCPVEYQIARAFFCKVVVSVILLYRP